MERNPCCCADQVGQINRLPSNHQLRLIGAEVNGLRIFVVLPVTIATYSELTLEPTNERTNLRIYHKQAVVNESESVERTNESFQINQVKNERLFESEN